MTFVSFKVRLPVGPWISGGLGDPLDQLGVLHRAEDFFAEAGARVGGAGEGL